MILNQIKITKINVTVKHCGKVTSLKWYITDRTIKRSLKNLQENNIITRIGKPKWLMEDIVKCHH